MRYYIDGRIEKYNYKSKKWELTKKADNVGTVEWITKKEIENGFGIGVIDMEGNITMLDKDKQ